MSSNLKKSAEKVQAAVFLVFDKISFISAILKPNFLKTSR